MNLRRAISGPLLSLIFLVFFAYMLAGLRWGIGDIVKGQNNQMFLGSVSGAVKNYTLADYTPGFNATAAFSVESDLQSSQRIIFEKSSNTILPIASLTKLMTAIVVLDNYNLSDITTVSAAADSQAPMKQDVKLGDTFPVEGFLDMMLVGSSNKSAYALAELIGEEKFVAEMNQRAKDIGLANTSFADPTGLSAEDVSTAADLVKFAEYIIKNYPKITAITSAEKFYVPGFGTVTNTDQLIGEYPEIIFSKTGFTSDAKGCLLLAVKNPQNSDYVIGVVLGADDRFLEMKKIINWSGAISN